MQWTYNDELLDSIPESFDNVAGVVYKLHYANEYYYIGMKRLQQEVTIPALKSGIVRDGYERVHKRVLRNSEGKIVVSKGAQKLARANGAKGTLEPYDRIIMNSKTFMDYEGSSEHTEGHVLLKKEILHVCPDIKTLGYYELKEQICHDVLYDTKALNFSIQGRYFKKV